jgi:transposase
MNQISHTQKIGYSHSVRLLLTAGQASEYGQANTLIKGFTVGHVVADKGYDSDDFVETIESSGATAVIPPRRHRKNMRAYDRHIYKDRNLVERFFQKIKNFRRIATRYERLAQNYLSMLQLVATVIWIQ